VGHGGFISLRLQEKEWIDICLFFLYTPLIWGFAIDETGFPLLGGCTF
jgi:hypothetical protein